MEKGIAKSSLESFSFCVRLFLGNRPIFSRKTNIFNLKITHIKGTLKPITNNWITCLLRFGICRLFWYLSQHGILSKTIFYDTSHSFYLFNDREKISFFYLSEHRWIFHIETNKRMFLGNHKSYRNISQLFPDCSRKPILFTVSLFRLFLPIDLWRVQCVCSTKCPKYTRYTYMSIDNCSRWRRYT